MKGRGVVPRALGLLVSGLTAAVLLAAVSSPAFAKGGGGGGGGGGPKSRSDPPCSVAPGSVAVGAGYTVSVSGLSANLPLNVDVSYPSAMQVFGVGSDATGNLSLTLTALEAGSVPVTIYDVSGNKPVVVSTCSFTVS